ncbi:1-deoxy-D-xylulose-5-phosphate synthase [Amycolatopsis rhizosphaerae]|uniref:1-deoxy-D-xylulose-5-phosphate synthase n=1 Tax=Amycolatopsis rhizosphaerae TaxID=2053003 RepID=A0A558DKC4_9PSEU|nr:transketolase C-terminal domain-containing protein [Amycolatopsis rhizosphaerae]TVT61466.1 1-deoxy-D-xylulose-5-phosphate synthase [Amycolatopsis rhizosphaerae]
MRAAFVETLAELAEQDPRVVLLTGDLGFNMLEPFAERFPDRFFNIGVAEQNMVGVATGLAEAGMIPFVYSIATFASMRPYEFIRNGPVLHQLPVRIVGVGGGFEYGNNGATHYGLEDVGILRLQRGLTVVVPADAAHARGAFKQTYALPRPIYYRLSKGGAPVPGLTTDFELGRLTRLRTGSDIALIALGSTATDALAAAAQLGAAGVEATVAVVESFNPSPVDDLADLLSDVSFAVSVESHFVDGGLGTLVAEVIAERGLSTRLRRCGLDDLPRGTTGSVAFLKEQFGLSATAIARTVTSLVASARP